MCVILTLQSCTQIKVPFQVPLWYNYPYNRRSESTTKVPFLFQMMEKVTSKEKPSSFQRTVAETLDLSAFEITCRSSASAGLRKPCHVGLHRGPFHARCRGWRRGSAAWRAWPARTCRRWRRSRHPHAFPDSSW